MTTKVHIPSDLETLTEGYFLACRSAGKSPRTVAWYEEKLTRYRRWLTDWEYPRTTESLTPSLVRRFVADLQARTRRWDEHPNVPTQEGGLSPYTVRGFVQVLKGFASWLYHEGLTESNLLAVLEFPRTPRRVPPSLSEGDIRRLLQAVNQSTLAGVRDYALLCLFLDTGLRLSEAVGLTMADLHLEEGWVRVMGKGAKERLAPFGSACQRVLWRWLQVRPQPVIARREAVFLTWDGRPMTRHAVQEMTRFYGGKAGLPVKVHPHLLRHTFALNFLRSGGDVLTLQKLLGHSSLEMVRWYVSLTDGDVTAAHRRHSPLDQLGVAVVPPKRRLRVVEE